MYSASAVDFAPLLPLPHDEGVLRALERAAFKRSAGCGKLPIDLGQIATLQVTFDLALFGDKGQRGAGAKSQPAALYPKETADTRR
jgi:hypothetical protein